MKFIFETKLLSTGNPASVFPIIKQLDNDYNHNVKCNVVDVKVLRDLGEKVISTARGINYYLGVISFLIIGPGCD